MGVIFFFFSNPAKEDTLSLGRYVPMMRHVVLAQRDTPDERAPRAFLRVNHHIVRSVQAQPRTKPYERILNILIIIIISCGENSACVAKFIKATTTITTTTKKTQLGGDVLHKI